jgi:uncharacterized protein YbjT (DUF2867 family)
MAPSKPHVEIFMNRILITGASGNIGQHLVRALRAQGTGFETLSSKPSASTGVRTASYSDPAALQQAFSGIDTLFVLLPLSPDKLTHARVVANAAKAAGVRHIVRSSGAGADPLAGYALPRLQGQVDRIFEDTGLATTFLRPAGFMQNYLSFLAGMVKTGSVYGATADAPQSLVDVRDIAAVAALVLANPGAHAGKAYTLTGGEALTDSQRAATLARLLARPVHFVAVPPEAAAAGMRESGVPELVLDCLVSLNALISAGYAAAISPDVQHLLGRAPITFERFANDHLGAWA